MPDDVTTTDDEPTGAPVAHDDIMKRLLDYQRQLRESSDEEEPTLAPRPMVDYAAAEAQAATVIATEQVVDLTEVDEDDVEIVDVVEIPEAAAEPEEAAPEDAKKAEAEAMRQRVAEEAAPAATQEPSLVQTAPVEASKAEPPTQEPGPELADRVAELEASLEKIAGMLAAVRSDFQDLAIKADERIASIEEELNAARGSDT